VTVVVSPLTKPKPEREVVNPVYGLAPLPAEGEAAWYERLKLWAAVVAFALVVGVSSFGSLPG
jgi:hypothetical protein